MLDLKSFADEKLNFALIMLSVCDRLEKILQKGENADYKHFLLFLQCFQKSSTILSKSRIFKTQTCL